MYDVNQLVSRIGAEFAAMEEKFNKFRVDQVQEHQDRQKRLAQLGQVFDQLREVWRPRLEALVRRVAHLPCNSLLESIATAVETFAGGALPDDLTILVAKFLPDRTHSEAAV